MIRTFEGGPAITLANVEALEQRYQIQLPSAYREFLVQRNGGRPERDLFALPACRENPTPRIHFFFGIEDQIESANVAWNIDVFRERLGRHLVPIATTEGADKICLDLDTGQVKYWDGYSDKLLTAADSFESFIDKLHRDELSPEPVS
jgi:hypothetical protein